MENSEIIHQFKINFMYLLVCVCVYLVVLGTEPRTSRQSVSFKLPSALCSVMNFCAVLLFPAQDRSHPFL